MNTLPARIIHKIMLFNSHPIADIIKESTIFNYIEFYEMDDGGILRDTHFKHGCVNKYVGEYKCREIRDYLLHYSVDSDKADYEYNIGYNHHPTRDECEKSGFTIRFRIKRCKITEEVEKAEHTEGEEDDSDSDSDSD